MKYFVPSQNAGLHVREKLKSERSEKEKSDFFPPKRIVDKFEYIA